MPTAVAQADTPERDGRASKPRTLIRMISTKFAPRAVSVPALRSPPAAPRSAFSKEQRDAALRERGLLPPLPNRDLSTQEREQDRHIPIVEKEGEGTHTSEGEGEGEGEPQPSAADLVKKEWEAKNSAKTEAEAASTSSSKQRLAADVNEDPRSSAPPAPSLAIKVGQRESSDMVRPSSLLADLSLSDEIQAFMFPLPPSLPVPPPASTDKPDVSEPATPAPRPRPPASQTDPDPDPDHETDPPLLRVNNRDSCGARTEESHSDASIITPSLDSTTQTLSSFSHRSVASSPSAANKKGALLVRTAGEAGEDRDPFSGDELGVVIEEDSVPPSPSPLTKAPPAHIKFKLDPVADKEAADKAPAVPAKDAAPPPSPAALKAPPSVERKRSMNPFKRAGTVSGAHGKDKDKEGDTTPRRRTTVGTTSFASLSNLRRSVVGTLSKTPASAPIKTRGTTDTVRGSPPVSPTVMRAGTGAGVGAGTPMARVRQPQQLVMYNRGSILLETAGIEDEETRRMTELAFLG